jgi:ADP-ribosylglycohydrolase
MSEIIPAGIMGLAIGDSLGMPFETARQDNPKLLGWDGSYQPSAYHRLNPGQYTDDTKATLIIAQSLIDNNGFRPADIAEGYVHWLRKENQRGMGRTTRLALENLNNGHDWTHSGVKDAEGNGTAMRASPFGMFFYEDLNTAAEFARMDARITHNSLEAQEGSAAVALASSLLFDGVDKLEIIELFIPYLNDSLIKKKLLELERITFNEPFEKSVQDTMKYFGTKAHVVETVPSAFAAFLMTSSYEECILTAIKAGGDTDSVGAIAGGMAGLFYGRDGIPQKYIDGIEDLKLLDEIDDAFFRMAGKE